MWRQQKGSPGGKSLIFHGGIPLVLGASARSCQGFKSGMGLFFLRTWTTGGVGKPEACFFTSTDSTIRINPADWHRSQETSLGSFQAGGGTGMNQLLATEGNVDGLGKTIGLPTARIEKPNPIDRLKSSPPSVRPLDEL